MSIAITDSAKIDRPQDPWFFDKDNDQRIFESEDRHCTRIEDLELSLAWWIRGYRNIDPNTCMDDGTIRINLRTGCIEEDRPGCILRAYGSIEVVISNKEKKMFAFGPVELETGREITVIPSIKKEDFPYEKGVAKAHITVEITEAPCNHFSSPTIFDCLTSAEHYVPDFEILCGGESFKVHRHFLAMISPVFHAMLEHNTVEAKTNTLTVVDFDMETVKNTIDFCYGRGETKNVYEVNEMLKFADKYDIKLVTNRLNDHFRGAINNDTFCDVAQRAWETDNVDMQQKCLKHYQEHHGDITVTSEFMELPVSVRDAIIRGAFALPEDDSDEDFYPKDDDYEDSEDEVLYNYSDYD